MRLARWLVVSAFVVVWLLIAGAASAAKPISVCPSGCSYASVQAAVDGAPSGATISIAAGTYAEALTVGKSLTLTGAGAGLTTLASPNSSRTITIDAGAVVTIKSLTVTSDGGFGGGIDNEGTLTLTASTVTGNFNRYAGGLLNEGTATLKSSTVSGNESDTSFESCFGADCTGGGGINNRGTMVLSNSTVSDNVSYGCGGGITSAGSLTLNDSIVGGNASYRRLNDPFCGGGGIGAAGSFTANNSTISNNTADDGGGIEIAAGNVTLKGTIVSGNTAASTGGGVRIDDADTFIQSSTLTLKSSTISGNTASADGGGIYNGVEGLIKTSGTTVSGNTSGASGGGIYNGQNAMLMLSSTAISGNSALTGGGIFNDDSIAPIPVWTDALTTITTNTPDNCEPDNFVHGCT